MSARNLVTLPITDIAIGDRVGFFNEAHARQIGASIAAEGQHDPIHVQRRGNAAKQPWMLVAGLHRLRGAAFAGLTTVDAVQVADASADADDLRWLELSETLDHRQRRPIERAIFIAERLRIEEATDHPDHVGESQHRRGARLRHSAAATMAGAGFRERTWVALNIKERSLERYLCLHREIAQALNDRELVQRLNDHALGGSMRAMEAITQRCKPDKAGLRSADPYHARRALVQIIIDNPEIASVDEAYQILTNGPSKGDRALPHAHDERALNLWAKMTQPQRQNFVAGILEQATPDFAAEILSKLKEKAAA